MTVDKMYNQIDTKRNILKTILVSLTVILILWNLMYSLSYNENNIEKIKEASSTILQDCNHECKFIFPYVIPEQETRANLHIRSYIQLAESLDRILVIPNVGSSRFAASSSLSPTFYYDFNLLQKMFPNAKFVPQEVYKLWIENQPNYKIITAEHILLETIRSVDDFDLNEGEYEGLQQQQNIQNGLYESFMIPKNSSGLYYKNQTNFIDNNKNILYKSKINIVKLKEVRILKINERKKFSEFMIENLKSDSQILLINVNLRQPMFQNMYKPIPYAKHIRNEALKIVNQLESSYIAIHWRMEKALPENMPNCARNLVKEIQRIRRDTGIKNVYLATDFPISCNKNGSIIINSGEKAQSGTFHKITLHHIKAMKILISAIKGIKTWKSLNGFGYLKYIGKEKEDKGNILVKELKGSGVQGILDKLVCINSSYFLSGPKGCCRIKSTYTRQIAESRKQLLREGNKNILNNITRWKKQ
ncbi:10551_t:CDS:1 [Entrophospora sp. SA101]|nr:3117_t:CDS:1 [Entrophospora sp. SA101]CAJ0833483.1 10551_t:CDS:1 [Entrophospora sp. SA101]CAJ0842614.1 11261_t:CDS:1 [Entrophospora sp. SA101]CAJ0903738.1 15658_t:CDS:1 [Entrophospora sp. SA101]